MTAVVYEGDLPLACTDNHFSKKHMSPLAEQPPFIIEGESIPTSPQIPCMDVWSHCGYPDICLCTKLDGRAVQILSTMH